MSKAIVLQDKNGETVYPVGIGSSLQAITDLFYPVGSYYETSDTTFDPNVSWTGTWVKDTTGKVTVGSGSGYNSGSTGGSTTHTIASSELPTHTHTYSKSNAATASHTLTTSEIPKHKHSITFYNDDFSNGGDAETSVSRKKESPGLTYDVAYKQASWSYSQVSEVGGSSGHAHNITLTSTNSGNGGFANTAMSIMQPYIVVNRWHRTA